MPGYTATVKGLEELQRLWKKHPAVTEKHTRVAMEAAVSDVVREVKPLVPVFQGTLRNSIASEIQGSGPKIAGIVGSTLKEEVYPAVMEFGRRPGANMPPPSALERWVHLVLQVPTDKAPGVAFVVARAIGRRGIKGKRFLKQGFENSLSSIQGHFGKALRAIVMEISGHGS